MSEVLYLLEGASSGVVANVVDVGEAAKSLRVFFNAQLHPHKLRSAARGVDVLECLVERCRLLEHLGAHFLDQIQNLLGGSQSREELV